MNPTSFSGLFSITDLFSPDLVRPFTSEQYHIFFFSGKGTLTVDYVEYEFDGHVVLFTSPFQQISLQSADSFAINMLSFHGDFYCIEFHKKEVACNGLLFNNIYAAPFISVPRPVFEELTELSRKLSIEIENKSLYSDPILKAYLQLILAIGSKIKSYELESVGEPSRPAAPIVEFKRILETHFIHQRSPSFYAKELALSSSVFTKKCKLHYGKTPSQLIQDRVILEAKKLIHLTHKNFKEIAFLLNFQDEHYFSRYFKKHTRITPTLFREQVGISIVADLSNP